MRIIVDYGNDLRQIASGTHIGAYPTVVIRLFAPAAGCLPPSGRISHSGGLGPPIS
jgi:hypothetical protein